MSYVTQDYYDNSFKGESVSDFPSLLIRAEEIIEEMTMYRLTPVTILTMPENTQERIKKAVCAQIEYLDANGGGDFDNVGDLQGASLGKFSYSGAVCASGKEEKTIQSPRAWRILAPTGLLYRGGGCY